MSCVSCNAARFLLIPALAAFTSVAFGQGGPLLTDDPGTPGNRNWEINFASMLVFIREQRYVQAPLLDGKRPINPSSNAVRETA
jgi:hypothetical protein